MHQPRFAHMPSAHWWAAGALALATLLLYSFGLEHTPPYLHEAEILFGLHAHAIATSGRDMYGRLLPLYFQMQPLGDTTWWHPALVYFTAPFLLVLPVTETVLRFPSVVVAAIDVVLVFFIARRLLGTRDAGIVAAVLLALTPAHFMQGRIAMDYIYPLPFVLGWLWALLVYLERGRPCRLFLATSLLGLGVYSYIASVIMMPVYVLITGVTLYATGHRQPRLWALAVAGACWPLAVLPFWLWFHPEVVSATLNRYVPVLAQSLEGRLLGMPLGEVLATVRRPEYLSNATGRVSVYWYFFDPAFLFVTGGYASLLNSTRHVGVFLLPLLVLVPLGLWRALTRGDVGSRLVVAGFVTAPIAAVLAVPEPYAIDREMALVPFGALLATLGVAWLRERPTRWGRRTAMVLLLAVPLHFGFFAWDYFVDYRPRAGFWFGLNHRGAVETLVAGEAGAPTPAVYLSVTRDLYLESYWQFAAIKFERPDLLRKTVAFDADTLDIGAVPSGSLLLMNRNDPPLERIQRRDDIETVAVIPEIGDEPFYRVLRKR